MKSSSLKSRLHNGTPLCCLGVLLGEPTIVETAAQAGIDLLFVCLEHGTRSPDRLEAVARIALALGIPAVARLPYPNAPEASRLLEMGFQGTILPHARTAAQVKSLIHASCHPPRGGRSFATCVRAAGWGAVAGPDHIRQADDAVVGIMIEDAEAVERAEELLAFPELDLVFIGRADLSLSMLGRYAPSDRVILDATRKIAALCRKRHIAPMTYLETNDQAPLFRDMGIQILVAGADTGYWEQGCQETAAMFRRVFGMSP